MSPIAEFVSSASALLAAMVVISAFTLRATNAPLWSKVVIPMMMMALAFYVPTRINGLLGSPQKVTCEQLPKSFYIVSFVSSDDAEIADLFTRTSGSTRTYEVSLDAGMKTALAGLRPKLSRGPVHISRNCENIKPTSPNHAETSSVDENGESVLQDDLETPKKDADE